MEKKIVIFGATGFIGKNLISQILKEKELGSFRIYAVSRNFAEAAKVSGYSMLGKVHPVVYHPKDVQGISRLLADAYAVINVTGVLMVKSAQQFFDVHHEFPKLLAKLCHKYGVSRLIHISAIGANKDSPSRYAQSKALGEEAVQAAFPKAVIYRPSIIVGKDDHFFSQFGQMAGNLPFLPVPPPQPDGALFAPIWVMDVVRAIITAINNYDIQGIYELQGSRAYRWRKLMELISKTVGVKRKIICIPAWFLRFGGVTKDQAVLLYEDNIASKHSKGLEDLGLQSTPLEPLMDDMLEAFSYRPQLRTA